MTFRSLAFLKSRCFANYARKQHQCSLRKKLKCCKKSNQREKPDGKRSALRLNIPFCLRVSSWLCYARASCGWWKLVWLYTGGGGQ
eukprot:5086487-Amphidinium_carterae.2